MQDWKTISADPNSAELLELRRQALRNARVASLIDDRIAYLCQIASGRKVLDVGVVEHTVEAVNSPGWLHAHIRKTARSCVGVDVLEPEIQSLKSRGYNVVCLNIVEDRLGDRFDLIICGELVEHLDLPGRLFFNCSEMLLPGGRLVLTTPNPWYANVVFKNLLNWSTFVDSADHVAWFDPATLVELGSRHGLRLDRFCGLKVDSRASWKSKLFFGAAPLLCRVGIKPEFFAKSILYEFVKESA